MSAFDGSFLFELGYWLSRYGGQEYQNVGRDKPCVGIYQNTVTKHRDTKLHHFVFFPNTFIRWCQFL